jgi:hypothetical protein
MPFVSISLAPETSLKLHPGVLLNYMGSLMGCRTQTGRAQECYLRALGKSLGSHRLCPPCSVAAGVRLDVGYVVSSK